MNQQNKYARTIKAIDGQQSISVDVYCVLEAFKPGNPAIEHAIKKLLCGGQRGEKSKMQDWTEAIASIQRAIQMEGKDEP